VQRQTCGYLPSRRAFQPFDRYKIIVLGERGACVSGCLNPRLFSCKSNAKPSHQSPGHRHISQSGTTTKN